MDELNKISELYDSADSKTRNYIMAILNFTIAAILSGNLREVVDDVKTSLAKNIKTNNHLGSYGPISPRKTSNNN